MTTEDASRAGFSLRRWSARKRAAAQEGTPAPEAPGPVPAETVSGATAPAAARVAAPATTPAAAGDAVVDAIPSVALSDDARSAPGASATPAIALPPIESLTPQSDFTPFMRPDVDPALKTAALRKLFADPHFNVMDGLDVYIDDYSKPDPIPPGILATLVQARYILNPPVTRVNAQGVVEDVPPDESRAAPGAESIDGAASAVSLPAAQDVRDAAIGESESGTTDATDAKPDSDGTEDGAQLDLPLALPTSLQERK